MISSSKLLVVFGLVIIPFCFQIETTTGTPVTLEQPELNYKISLKLESEDPIRTREGRAANKKLNVLDKVNVDTYLKNTKAVNMQIKCVLKDGPCDTIGKEIKRLMPMVLHDANLCDECNQTQTKKIRKIIDHIRDNYPEDWSEGVKQYGKPAGL